MSYVFQRIRLQANLTYNQQGPFKGTVTYGIVSTVFVAVLVIDELIDMLSIGTLIAYIMASVSIIRLRYKPINGDYLNGNSSSKSYIEHCFSKIICLKVF